MERPGLHKRRIIWLFFRFRGTARDDWPRILDARNGSRRSNNWPLVLVLGLCIHQPDPRRTPPAAFEATPKDTLPNKNTDMLPDLGCGHKGGTSL